MLCVHCTLCTHSRKKNVKYFSFPITNKQTNKPLKCVYHLFLFFFHNFLHFHQVYWLKSFSLRISHGTYHCFCAILTKCRCIFLWFFWGITRENHFRGHSFLIRHPALVIVVILDLFCFLFCAQPEPSYGVELFFIIILNWTIIREQWQRK